MVWLFPEIAGFNQEMNMSQLWLVVVVEVVAKVESGTIM
jgi:hypothetical protein